jgi:copper chaperone
MDRRRISVSGLSCGGCEQNVETALNDVDGVTEVDADHENGTVEVVTEDDVGDDDLHSAIEQAGYEVGA